LRGPWDDVRDQFALSRDHVHLAACLLAAHPKPVRDAIERHRRSLDENPALVIEPHGHPAAVPQNARVLASAARYLEVSPGEIALTDSTTRRSHGRIRSSRAHVPSRRVAGVLKNRDAASFKRGDRRHHRG